MPVLDIGGQKVSVGDEFLKLSPEQQNATVHDIAQSLAPKAEAPATAPSEGSSLSGVGKSILSGMVGGAADLAQGAVGLSSRLLGQGDVPSLRDSAGALTGGSLYQPKGTAEEYARTVGEFLPAVAGGPEGLGLKLATRVAAPAIASETAGQLTAGTAAEPYARAGAALMGGVGGAMAANRLARPAVALQPSAEQLFKSADGGFNTARDMNVVVKPTFAINAADEMRDAIKNFDPNVVKDVHAAADRLERLGKPTMAPISPAQRLQSEMNWEPMATAPKLTPVAMNDLEHIRQQLVSLKTSPDGSIRTAAKEAIKSLQKSQMGITQADTLAGDAARYAKTVGDAVGDWAAMRRSNAVTGKIDLANLNAGTAGSGSNFDNAQRQAIKQLARPIINTNTPVWKKLGFNNEEGAAIFKAATGTPVGNTARYIGKAAPTGIVSGGLSGGAGFAMGGPLGAVALPAVGYVAKKIGDLSTKKAVAALDSLVRSRSPLAQQVAAKLPQITQQLSPATTKLLATLSVGQAIASRPQPIIAGSN